MTQQQDQGITAIDVIATKRDGGALNAAQIRWVIDAYVRGEVAHEQMSALTMAIVLNGMNREEIALWTQTMADSGQRMDFSQLQRKGHRLRTVDKHSTGGVGDKITLPLAPLVACHGVAVPQLSGRSLGHTGGTLDKLESIPGWRAEISDHQFLTQLENVGAAICAAGGHLAPADKKLYALRDATATVHAPALIASSIMSKKIASGAEALVLDVKVGSGAFMDNAQSARQLAEIMVGLGQEAGVKTVALLTDMSTPLGQTVGNACEVREAVEVLAGGGPSDVVELTLVLAREMLQAVGLDADPADALRQGKAMDTWRSMIRAQGGDPDAALPTARHAHTVRADSSGVVHRVDALGVGKAAWFLGAGRKHQQESVQPAAGVVLHVSQGQEVVKGQPLATLHTDTQDSFDVAETTIRFAFDIQPGPFETRTGATVLIDRVDVNDL